MVERHSGQPVSLVVCDALKNGPASRAVGPQAAKTLAEHVQHPKRAFEDPYGRLTARERAVFHLMAEGMTTKSRRLGISVKTAENHRGRVLDKLDVRNSAELVRCALRKGQLDWVRGASEVLRCRCYPHGNT